MSATQSPSKREEPSPQDAFDAVVWENSDVCNHCLSRIRRRHPEFEEARDEHIYENQNHLRWSVSSFSTRDPSTLTGYFPDKTASSSRRRTFCQCGHENGLAKDTDYTYDELKDRLRSVINRLTETGLDVDETAMYDFVEEAKSKRQIGGRDTQILRRATKLGLKHA